MTTAAPSDGRAGARSADALRAIAALEGVREQLERTQSALDAHIGRLTADRDSVAGGARRSASDAGHIP